VKHDVGATVQALNGPGVSLKVITGDNALVARQVAVAVGIPAPVVLTARGLGTTSDDALPVRAATTDVFAEIEPNRCSASVDCGGHLCISTVSSFSTPKAPGTPRAFIPAIVLSASLSTSPINVMCPFLTMIAMG
jgi:hypothetical protein